MVLQPTVAARFCPVLFDLEETDGDAPLLPIELPYRMVFAVASKDTVTLYDTQVDSIFSRIELLLLCIDIASVTKLYERSHTAQLPASVCLPAMLQGVLQCFAASCMRK